MKKILNEHAQTIEIFFQFNDLVRYYTHNFQRV